MRTYIKVQNVLMARSVVSDVVYVGSGNVACRKYPFILPKEKYIVRGCTTIVV